MKRWPGIVVGVAAVVAACGVVGCRSDAPAVGRAVAADVDPALWQEPAAVAFENRDTAGLYDLALFVRFDRRFVGDTLTVRVATQTPDSLRCEEPLRLELVRGRTPAALAFESAVPYRHRVRLARSGTYEMIVTPTRAVQGIEAVGIHLVKSE